MYIFNMQYVFWGISLIWNKTVINGLLLDGLLITGRKAKN
jgi:hypothetical protein